MEIEAPYLQAIQAIAGKTPGEKRKTINLIGRQLAKNSAGHSVESNASVPDVPELLKPLVRVQVAEFLRQCDAIIEALQSEDLMVLSRAVKAKWFFDGTDSRVVNAQYFLDNVFPKISLRTRYKVVANFGLRLKNSKVAEEFFHAVAEEYGVSQAVPLLPACDEEFASKMMLEEGIVLSSQKTIKTLYRKYPDLVIKYLTLNKCNNENNRNFNRINIRDFKDILPQIANERLEDFMEIYELYRNDMNFKLGRRAANTFVKTKCHLLVEMPHVYLKLVPLQIVTRKLSAENFATMFKNCFTAEKDHFNYQTLNCNLSRKPEQERLSLIFKTFREVYGEDLLSCPDLVNLELIKVLPALDRVKQARLKLENDKDWYLGSIECSWRCYLPVAESVPLITNEIAKTSDSGKRGCLLRQLVYTTKVNDDKDAFLQVLTYIYNRHRNEQPQIFYSCVETFVKYFDLAKLSSAHWVILNQIIKFSEIKDELYQYSYLLHSVVEASLHYNLLSDLPIDDHIRMLIDINMKAYCSRWNVLRNCAELERELLEMFIENIPKQYPFGEKIWNEDEYKIIHDLATSIWDFNRRHCVSNGKLKKLSIKDYPWLLEKIKSYIYRKSGPNQYGRQILFLDEIKRNNSDLYNIWIRDFHNFWDYGIEVIMVILKENPQRVLNNWQECFNKIRFGYRDDSNPALFAKKSKWYHQLPVNFFNEALNTFKEPSVFRGSMLTLALLSDGETFAKIIEPFLPNSREVEIDHPDAKDKYGVLFNATFMVHKVNPPVSLDIIARLCVGDYLQMGLRSLMSVSHRVPITKVIPFARKLTNSRVSVMKHGIRLIYSVAPLEEICNFLTDFWNTKTHTSIRGVLFTKINDLFYNMPDSRSWRMMRTCIKTLNINDDDEIFQGLAILSMIPNEYIQEYIESVLGVLDSVKQLSDDPKKIVNYSCNLIRNIDGSITRILSEEYCQDLIKRYLFDFDYDSDIFDAGKYLTINSYLLASKEYNELRFQFFGDLFRDSVKTYWDQSHPKNFKVYPMNVMVQKFVTDFCSRADRSYDVRMLEALLEIFQSVLQPYQNCTSYLGLIYSIEYHRAESWKDFGASLAEKVSDLIEIFSPECIILIANSLASFVKSRKISESEDEEEKVQDIIEALAKKASIHCACIAGNMLFNKSKKLNERHKAVVRALRNFHHPGISAILNLCLTDN